MNNKVHPKGTLYIVAAPSGAGKSSLVRALIDSTKQVRISISHTTRAPRPGESDGVNYYFVDDTEFENLVQQGQFLEHAKVYGHMYGTSKAVVAEQLEKGNDVLLEIDWQGANQVKKLMPEAVSIYILPPSLDDLEKRLINRRQDNADVIAKRMEQAQEEISHCHEFDYLVINKFFDTALTDIRSIVRARRLRKERQFIKHQELINNLIEK